MEQLITLQMLVQALYYGSIIVGILGIITFFVLIILKEFKNDNKKDLG